MKNARNLARIGGTQNYREALFGAASSPAKMKHEEFDRAAGTPPRERAV